MDDAEKLGQNDHRRLGRELDLFVFSDLVGPGLPLWTPRGTILRRELDKFVQEMRDEHGFQEVTIPHLTKNELYKKSGHWDKFSEELFRIKSREGHEFAMKPMSCPHHTQIYASRPRSYRELPIRYRETTMCYRDEQTGELNGILRPRVFTQDDAHVFCRQDQIVEEVLKIWDIIERFYGAFDFKLSLRFSKRDPKSPKSYSGSDERWTAAEAELQKAIDKHPAAMKAKEGIGEAAFYAPKLDFMSHDSLGREWQVATIQLDVAQPHGIGLNYINEAGEEEVPFMIHCAIMGSIERFLGVYLEHTGGKFPVWLAPEQVRIATVNQESSTTDFAAKVLEMAKQLGVRASLDNDNESVGKKIRGAEVMKVPYTLVIGQKEVESGEVTPRVRSDLAQGEPSSQKLKDFLQMVADETKNRTSKS